MASRLAQQATEVSAGITAGKGRVAVLVTEVNAPLISTEARFRLAAMVVEVACPANQTNIGPLPSIPRDCVYPATMTKGCITPATVSRTENYHVP